MFIYKTHFIFFYIGAHTFAITFHILEFTCRVHLNDMLTITLFLNKS